MTWGCFIGYLVGLFVLGFGSFVVWFLGFGVCFVYFLFC